MAALYVSAGYLTTIRHVIALAVYSMSGIYHIICLNHLLLIGRLQGFSLTLV